MDTQNEVQAEMNQELDAENMIQDEAHEMTPAENWSKIMETMDTLTAKCASLNELLADFNKSSIIPF